jgi:hypothetical protein
MSKSRRRRDGEWDEPDALRKFRDSLTEDRRLALFRETFDRDPTSEDELDLFIENYTLEVYNSGDDEL